MLSLFINWDVDPVLLSLGSIKIQYYGLLFVLSFILGYKVEEKMFKSEGIRIEWLDKLIIYVAIGTIAGARLGHCFFYDWAYFSEHPLEIILPFRFEPEFEFTGYRGLASHGAAIGIIASLWFYSKKVTKRSILWALDRSVLPIALSGFFIRLGNLMNSEIIGKATDVSWGFRFLRSMEYGDPTIPRHPAQLYESICYLAIFFALRYLYWKTDFKNRRGFLFGMFLILVFAARFCIEFVKEPQEAFEQMMFFNMGQMLSIPFVLIGAVMIWYSSKHIVQEKKK